ncbi:conserved fungal protein [Sugiyamaella lignohabitans]|uniref:Conserved fungal protein n=1 Tax=Sugiyamaella lignohabitans TaxID=796027 RepID=A0A161HI16_9ASCO|nr:uncharacterized protein AWJ20_215 [Sugiyamaella lignohabitans]ANB11987.1 conserved fungal protein [Sugiyamaella lignohabitans]
MPRKRARNPLKRKQVDFDTAPSVLINPKKVSKKNKAASKPTQNGDDMEDDMPKEFKRLMNWSNKKQGKVAKGTEGEERGRSRTRESTSSVASISNTTPAADLKILPGERMSDFSRRVNEALPLVKARKGSPSRADKRKARKRAKDEANSRKKKDDDDDDDNDEDDEDQKPKKGKREPSPDPWAHLESKKPKFGDVADRPPELNLPTKLLRNVPKSAGSLARRVILEEERDRVIQSYRALMEQKRGGDVL